jgi:hypothetical protein
VPVSHSRQSILGKTIMKMISLFAVGLLITTFRAPAEAKTFNFAGYNWMVKSGSHLGPGPNNWDEDNVWVDQHGYLHLAITNRGGQWYCSQVSMVDRLGFGRYQFWIIGRVDQLDPNVVFGLFNYPTPDVGSDATREIDIEFAEWGKPNTPIGNYTVWPAKAGFNRAYKRFSMKLNGGSTTHRFIWHRTSVRFQSLYGHRNDDLGQFAGWLYQPSHPPDYIGDQPLPVQINLWLFKGKPPGNRQPVELIVRSFKFTPE